MAVKKKKVSKKVEKKVEKEEIVPENVLNGQLLSSEIANMEVLYAETNQVKAEMNVKEQYRANLTLKAENLQLQYKLLEQDIRIQDKVIREHDEKHKNVEAKMIKYIEEIKQKYGVKSNDMIQYDRMTGKIVK